MTPSWPPRNCVNAGNNACRKDLLAWAWGQVGRHAALKLAPEAMAHYASAWSEAESGNVTPIWSDEVLAWNVRAALRSNAGAERWRSVQRAIDHMSETEQRDPAWRYWRARAMRETAAPAAAGDRQLTQALAALQQLAGELHFYGKLASEDLGQPVPLPPLPAPLSASERATANAMPGLDRALQLIALGLRNEGVREWNFSLRGMNDRALLAAADRACAREVWDRCINTSDRTRNEVDLAQRYPMPYRAEVVAKAGEIGLDPAYVYGLIRQESRFITDARSSVGASGLMQVMPATARWTAKKIGLPFTADMITDRDTNLRIGTGYLKLVLDDFDGSQTVGGRRLQRRPEPATPLARGRTDRARDLGREHPVQRDARLRQEGAVQRHRVCRVAGRAGAGRRAAASASRIGAGCGRIGRVATAATVVAASVCDRVVGGLGLRLRSSAASPVLASPASASASRPSSPASRRHPSAVPAAPVLVVHALLPSLKARLGALIGPRASSAPPPDAELP